MNVKVTNLKGEKGGVYISGAGTTTGLFEAIYAHEDSVVTLVSLNITGTLTSVPIPKGSFYLGRFTSVAWESGKVTAYNAEIHK